VAMASARRARLHLLGRGLRGPQVHPGAPPPPEGGLAAERAYGPAAALRESSRALLRAEDVDIATVDTAGDALAGTPSDCMVLDLKLPDGSGYDVLEKMGAGERGSFPPVLVYTGRQLGSEDEQRLRRYSRSIIIKGAKSPERLLDEVTGVDPQMKGEPGRTVEAPAVDDADFELEQRLLLEAIYAKYSHDFRGYSPISLRRRLRRALTELRLPTLSLLQDRILRDPRVSECATVGVRDPARPQANHARLHWRTRARCVRGITGGALRRDRRPGWAGPGRRDAGSNRSSRVGSP
jgi:CheY-like chemotaxis protein